MCARLNTELGFGGGCKEEGAQEGEPALGGAVGALGGLAVRVECKEGAAGPASHPQSCLKWAL